MNFILVKKKESINMKNKLVVLSLLSFMFTFGVMAQGITMTMPAVVAPAAGANVSVPLKVTNFNNVGAVSLEITYNTAVMTYSSISPVAPVTFTVGNTTPGIVRLGWYAADGKTLLNIGSGTVLNLNFKYISGTGSYAFTTANCEITDGVGTVITGVSYQGGNLTAPATPTGFTVTPSTCGTGTMNISWNASSGATSYTVYRDGGSIYNGSTVYSVSSPFAATGLVASSWHSYGITASNSAGPSALFTIPTSLQAPPICAPAPPSNFTVTPSNCGTGTMNISWSASSGATSYTVYRDGSSIYNGSGLTTSATGLVASSWHSYGITASNSAGPSALFTIPTSLQAPPTCPPATVTISGTVGNGGGGISGVTMNGLGVSTTSNGSYTGTVNYGWSGSVSPSKSGYAFSPSLKSYSNVTLNQVQNYTATKLAKIAADPDELSQVVEIPRELALRQNFPNPFNPTTVISYQLPDAGAPFIVSLKIYDMLGREVVTLVDDTKEAGYYNVAFNASHLSSGMFFARLVAQSDDSKPFVQTIKLLLTK
jgi:hypothetical protein